MWQQAQLDNERRKAMMDNEFYWLTEGRAKLAQAELLETEAKYRPFMYQQQMLENANNNYLNYQNLQMQQLNSFRQGIDQENQWKQQNYSNKANAIQVDNANQKDLYSIKMGNAIDAVNAENNAAIAAYNAQNNANLTAEQIKQGQHHRSFVGQIAPVVGNAVAGASYGWARNGFKKMW